MGARKRVGRKGGGGGGLRCKAEVISCIACTVRLLRWGWRGFVCVEVDKGDVWHMVQGLPLDSHAYIIL